MIEKNSIINADCLEAMKDIPDGSVDAIITDLPYGTTRNAWDSVIPLDKLWEQYRRVIKRNGAIVLFSQQPFTSVLIASNLEMFRYEWIWEKENGSNFLNAHKVPLKVHENIAVFYDELPTYNPQMRQGFKPYSCRDKGNSKNYGKMSGNVLSESKGERYPIDVVKFSRDKDKQHPTQKPVDLIAYLIRTYSNEGDTVLDSCCGSGTTAIAAIREKRNFICIEKSEEYFNIAKKRIENELNQPTLF